MPSADLRRCALRWWPVAAVSAAWLTPSLWQARIQSADLESHVYNAWLAHLIAQGRAPGLYIVRQSSNVLFDWLLAFFLPRVGPQAAERVAVSLAVMALTWGAFALACAASRRRPWFLTPCIAMLAYGWVFHMGFFNYYLSVGICLAAVALCWKPARTRWLAAMPLLAVAWTAHAAPVAWAIFAIAYVALAKRLRPRYRPVLTAAAIALLSAVTFYLRRHFQVQWSADQNFAISGLDQFVVFGAKYFLVVAGMLVIWTRLFLRLADTRGMGRCLLAIPLHLAMCAAAAVFLIPQRILLPGETQPLGFNAQRGSLIVALCLCALLSAAQPRAWQERALAAIAMLFFALLYMDHRALNRDEDRLQAALATLAPGQRVLAVPAPAAGPIDPYVHMIDRACIGRCFSYANYEPSTGHFRIRARPGNSLVTAYYADSFAMQTGVYQVRAGDLPLWQIARCGENMLEYCVAPLAAGERSGSQIRGRANSSRLKFHTTTAAYR